MLKYNEQFLVTINNTKLIWKTHVYCMTFGKILSTSLWTYLSNQVNCIIVHCVFSPIAAVVVIYNTMST